MHLERIVNKYQHTFQLIVVGIIFVVLFNQTEEVKGELNNLTTEVSEVKLNQLFPQVEFSTDKLMESLADDDKLLNIYTGNLLLGMNQSSSDFLPVNKLLLDEIEVDRRDSIVFGKLARRLSSPTGSFKSESNVVQFFNKWELSVDGSSDFWVTNFPSNPYLAFNSELIPWPSCPEGTSPLIASTEAYRIGSRFVGELIVKEYQKLKAWQVTFDGIDLFDKEVISNQRALLLISCNK